MTTTSQLTEQEVRTFAEDWYRKLDVHAPLVELLPLLADADLEMVFPEATERGHQGFEHWYERVIRLFFDETHTVKEVKLTSQPDAATGKVDVKVVVNWQAHVWEPPAPRSKWLGFDAYQSWVVRRSASGGLEVVRYVVDSLDAMPGSESL